MRDWMFCSITREHNLCFPETILADIEEMIGKAGRKETGGILIGNYSEDLHTAYIRKATDAPIDSKAGPTWFKRGISGLKELLQKHWKKGEYYIGEWHYHPFALPNPSDDDITQMIEISKSRSYNCPEPILIIIGGSKGNIWIRSFVVLNESKWVELLQKQPGYFRKAVTHNG